VITITVEFSKPVKVIGKPTITLETGANDGVAIYASGTGTAKLNFVYTVATGHASADLSYTSASALLLNAGSIRDILGLKATVKLPVPGAKGSLSANAAIVVQTPMAPSVASFVRVAAQAAATSTLPILFDIQFSQPIVSGSFTASDLSNTGTATGVGFFVASSSDNVTFRIQANAAATSGTIIPRLAAGAVLNAAGMTNASAMSASSGVTYSRPVDSVPVNPVPPPAPTPDPPPSPLPDAAVSLGTNLVEVRDYNGEFPFVDAMKSAREWTSTAGGNWNPVPPIPIDQDANGAINSLRPGQWLRTRVVQGPEAEHPGCSALNGEYTIIHDGQLTLTFSGGATIDQAKSIPGRLVVDFDCTQGSLDLAITAMTAGVPMTDMKIIMPGGSCQNDQTLYCKSDAQCGGSRCEMFTTNYQTRPFHPRFLANIKKYSTIRFMDWMQTNNSALAEWVDRPVPENLTYSKKGVPLEVMLQLSNLLGADPWFTIPERASNDFVTKFAQMVQIQMAPGRKAYVEYTNEAWNGAFSSNAYVIGRGNAMNLGGATIYHNGARFYSRRAVEIFNIFTQYLGGTSRLIRVLSGQAANLGVASSILEYNNAFASADAFAIAPYIHLQDLADGVRFYTLADGLTDLARIGVPETMVWIRNHITYLNQIAARPGGKKLNLIAYEGGQHLVSKISVRDDATKQNLQALQDAMNRDPAMKQIYLDYLRGWKAEGGALFMHFNNVHRYSKYGRWGSMEHQFATRAESPKYDALMTFIENGFK
jgi:hypothetical protein